MRARPTSILILAMLTASAVAAPAATGSDPGVSISAQVGTCGVGGSAGDGTPVTLKLKTAQGQLKSTVVVSDIDGGTGFIGCFPGATIRPTDRISAKQSGITTAFAVPDLDITLNRVTDIIKGKAPDGWVLSVEVNRCLAVCDTIGLVDNVSVGPAWQIDHIGIIGGDRVDIRLVAPDEDHALYSYHVPYLGATIGRSLVVGAGAAGTPLTVTLRKNETTKGSVSKTPGVDMSWQGDLRKNGAKVNVQPGQLLRSSQGATFDVIATSATLILPAQPNRINGICMAGADAWELRIKPGTGATVIRSDTFDAGPTFVTTFDADDLAGGRLTLTCITADGDRIRSIHDIP